MVRKISIFAFAAITVACTATLTLPKVELNQASPEEKQSCRDLCNKIAQGTCLDAAGLSQCNQACESATSGGVATFKECTSGSSTCAKSCVDDLKSKGTTGSPDGSAGGDGSTVTDDASRPDAAPDGSTPTAAEIQACETDCQNQIFTSCEVSQTVRNQCHDNCRNKPAKDVSTFHTCMGNLGPMAGSCSPFYSCLQGFGLSPSGSP